jgi:hypothetical protein
MLYKDRDHEKTYRSLLRRAKRVEVRTGEKKVQQMRESEGEAAPTLDEDEEMEVTEMEVAVND